MTRKALDAWQSDPHGTTVDVALTNAIDVAKALGFSFVLTYNDAEGLFSASFNGTSKGEVWEVKKIMHPQDAAYYLVEDLFNDWSNEGQTYGEHFRSMITDSDSPHPTLDVNAISTIDVKFSEQGHLKVCLCDLDPVDFVSHLQGDLDVMHCNYHRAVKLQSLAEHARTLIAFEHLDEKDCLERITLEQAKEMLSK